MAMTEKKTRPDDAATYAIAAADAPFEDGFSWKTVIAAAFVGLIMMPASMLISMTTGMGIGSASDWVVVILFIEITKRALVRLKAQEILMIYWISAGLMAASGPGMAGGGPFGWYIWNQYLIQSPQAASLREWVPEWAIPSPDRFPDLYAARSLLHSAWLWPLGVMLVSAVLGMVNNVTSGYLLFRLFNDVEKLPFPMARVNAYGATALAESSQGTETWRWRMFTTGAMIGIVWGALYVGVPVIGGLFWTPPPMLIKIPFWDFTSTLANLGIYAVPFVIALNLGSIMAGWVLPWRLVMGIFAGTVCLYIAYPILYQAGVLTHWESGFGALATSMMNGIDFTISFQMGAALVVIGLGVASAVWTMRRATGGRAKDRPAKTALPAGRGDMPVWLAFALWIGSTLLMVAFAWWLINRRLISGEVGVSMLVLIGFGFIFSPLVQYLNGRMLAVMGGSQIQFPFLREACIFMSGARGARIWFAPLPLNVQAGTVEIFKQMELTRTRFTSYYKMLAASFLVTLVFSALYWALFWKMSQIPSESYPFIQRMWPFQAIRQLMWIKTTLPAQTGGGESIFATFLHPNIVVWGVLIGVAALLLTRMLKLSTMFFYGLVLSLSDMNLFNGLLMFVGGLSGRYFFRRRFGAERWQAYAPLILAGFGAGFGLAGLFSVGFSLLWKAASGG